MSTSAHYATSLSDEQWDILQLLLPESKWQPGGPGRPPLDLRRVVDGIFQTPPNYVVVPIPAGR